MAKPKIGYEYRLDIPEHLLGDSIAWVNKRSSRIFKTFGEIEGKIVKTKAITYVITPLFIVALLDYPKDSFYIRGKHLMELTRRLPIPCVCELNALLNQGCKCGAFKKEQSQKTK